MGGVFRAPKIQQRVVPVVDTEAEAKKRAEKEKQENKQVKIATREDFERVKKEYGG